MLAASRECATIPQTPLSQHSSIQLKTQTAHLIQKKSTKLCPFPTIPPSKLRPDLLS